MFWERASTLKQLLESDMKYSMSDALECDKTIEIRRRLEFTAQ